MACVAARAALWRGRCRGQVSHETLVAEMQQIADWLKKLGMTEYAQRFAENDIEFDILPELTDHDPERLGVSLVRSSPARAGWSCSSYAPSRGRA
jgi:hypothetical protein